MDLLATKRPRLLLTVFCLLLWLPGFFSLPPTDRDESRFAQASKQMLESGDYVRIMNGTEPRNRKPIGIYWLQVTFAAIAHRLGVAEQNPIWPYRLPSLLGGLCAVFCVFWFGEALVGKRAGLLAAGMLAASVTLVTEVHLAKTDAALLGVTTAAMGVLARAYMRPEPMSRGVAALFWLSMGVGILLKGPITPVVALLTVGTLVLCDRRARWLQTLRPWSGLALMALVVLPWFVAIGVATHGAFFHDSLGGDLAGKLVGGDDAHGAPPGLHLLLLPLLAFPSSFIIVAGLPRAWRARQDPAVRFLLAWLAPFWLVLEAVPTKLPHYTLPLYPALCLLGAYFFCQAGLTESGLWRWLAVGAHWLAAIVLAAGTLVVPGIVGAPSWLGIPACLTVGLIGWLGRDYRAVVASLAAMPLLALSLLGWELPQCAGLWVAPNVERVIVAAGLVGARLGAAGFHEPSLMFLTGTGIDLLSGGRAAADALANGRDTAVVVGMDEFSAFWQEARRLDLTPRDVGVVAGLNYSRGRAVILHVYRP